MSRQSSGKRPGSANSRNAWHDDGLDAPGRPMSQTGQWEFEQRDLNVDDPDAMPAAMEGEVFEDGQIHLPGQEKPKAKPKKLTACQKFGRGIRSIWATRLTEDNIDDPQVKARTALRELILYCVFLLILCILTFGMTSSSMFYYSNVMSNLFLTTPFNKNTSTTFQTMATMQDFWDFTNGPFVEGVHSNWETYYNNQPVNESELGYIFFENKLLGVPRIKQLKVLNNSCEVHPDFQDEIKQCFATYAEVVEDKNPFGKNNGTAWTYSTAKQLDGLTHTGKIAVYSGGGYYQDLANNSADTSTILNDLMANLWIDRGTRVVFFDFTVYNANINLFCVIRLTVEFPATGGVIPSWYFRTVKLIRYVTTSDFIVLGCEGIFILFIFYYMVEEILEIKKHRMRYFKAVWNWLDIIIILISVVCIIFNVYRTLKVGALLKLLLADPSLFPDFDFLSYWQLQYNTGVAFAVFLAWIKIFKYVSFNKTMTQLTTTLGKARKDLLGFLFMFMIIFVAFAQLGYLLFGTQVQGFSTVTDAMLTLFRIILGDFDFQSLESAHRALGPIYFMFYVFFVFFVLLNMFLAIINDTYSEVKAELAEAKNEFEMGEFFKAQYNKMMSKLNIKREKLSGIQKALRTADKDNDKKINIDEFRQELKLRGYSDQEIDAAFAKYDLDGNKILDEEEQRKMQDDLEGQRANLTREFNELENRVNAQKSRTSNTYSSGEDSDDEGTSGTRSSRRNPARPINGVAIEEFTVLSRRVDRMEHSIGSIVSKIDAVLVKLEAMEKAKLKRRETMGKLLDSINESDVHTDEMKRDQMERLVREELERWDSDSNIETSAAGSQQQRASPSAASGARVRSSNASQNKQW